MTMQIAILVTPPTYLWWIGGGVLAALALAVLIMWCVNAILHRRHDKAIEQELRDEETRHAPHVNETAAVTVVPEEELPQEGELIFMPVPASLSDMTDFVTEERDRVQVRSCVRLEDAKAIMEDADAKELRRVLYRRVGDTENMAYVTIDALSRAFAPYSYVNLEILKDSGLVDVQANGLTINGNGILRKPLMVEAHAFSCDALKMIAICGGRAVEVRDIEMKK